MLSKPRRFSWKIVNYVGGQKALIIGPTNKLMIIWKVHIPVLHLHCMYHHPISSIRMQCFWDIMMTWWEITVWNLHENGAKKIYIDGSWPSAALQWLSWAMHPVQILVCEEVQRNRGMCFVTDWWDPDGQVESDVFRTVNGKWHATVLEIARVHKTGHPMLLGTTSMEQSEALSKQLTEASIPHQVEGEHSFVSVIMSPINPGSYYCA